MTHSSENRPNYWEEVRAHYERTKLEGAAMWDDLPAAEQRYYFSHHFEDRNKPIACQE